MEETIKHEDFRQSEDQLPANAVAPLSQSKSIYKVIEQQKSASLKNSASVRQNSISASPSYLKKLTTKINSIRRKNSDRQINGIQNNFIQPKRMNTSVILAAASLQDFAYETNSIDQQQYLANDFQDKDVVQNSYN